MKVIMIGPFPPPIHGVAKSNEILFSGLREEYDVKIVDNKSEKRRKDTSSQGKFDFIKLFISFWPIISGLFYIFFSKKYTVVYLTPGEPVLGYFKYIPFMWAARIRKIPFFIHIHGGFFKRTYGIKKKIILNSLKNLSGAIVLGDSLKNIFDDMIPKEKIFVCKNGVENEIFATKKEIDNKMKRYKTEDTIRVLFLSNLLKNKGILDLLKAVRFVKDKGYKIHLDIAGSIEPSITNEIKNYITNLGNSATYYGIVSGKKKKELLLNNYFFCLPSCYPQGEGQPISILEALANGCYIITTNNGGIRDIVNDEVGVFVKEKNYKNIAKELIKKINQRIFESNWKIAKKEYSKNIFVKNIVGIIEKHI